MEDLRSNTILADFKDSYINCRSSYTSFLNSWAFVPLPRTHLVLASPSCLFYPSDLTCSSAFFNVPFYAVISQFYILLHFPLDSKLCDSRDQIYLVLSGLFKTMTHSFLKNLSYANSKNSYII